MKRRGFALLLVLLVISALELLTLATLVLATHENAVSSMQERMVQARYAADAALHRLPADWPRLGLHVLPIGADTAWEGDGGITLNVRRLRWGLYEVQATASAGRSHLRRTSIARTLDADLAFMEANDALVGAGPIASAASITATDTTNCTLPFVNLRDPRPITVARELYAVGLEDAVVDSQHAVLRPGYAVGGLLWSELAEIADTVVSGNAHFAAFDSAGVPVTRLVFAPQNLVVGGGHGRGLLLVDGDLEMRDAFFDGLIVVRGRAMIGDGVQIRGSLRVQGAASSELGSAGLTYARCAVGLALLNAPAAVRVVRSGRRYIPTF